MSSRKDKNWGPKKPLTELQRDRQRNKRTRAGRKGKEASIALGFSDAKKSADGINPEGKPWEGMR